MRIPSFQIPVASFASVIGIVALGLDWRATGPNGSTAYTVGEWLLLAGAFIFIALLTLWTTRIATRPDEVAVEARNPVTASLFGTIVISVSLLSAGVLPRSAPVATVLWAVATVAGFGLLVLLLAHWMERGIQMFELTPALFAPIVGNATTAFSGVPLGFAEFAWMSYAVALLTWLAIGPLIFYRLMVVEPRLPRKMVPQLGLLISSPAVLAAGWFALTGRIDSVFKLLAFYALFLSVVVVRMWRVGWGEPFTVVTWAWTFPTAALAGTFGLAARALPDPLYSALARITIVVATLTVALCTLGTVRGWIRRIVSAAATAPAHDR